MDSGRVGRDGVEMVMKEKAGKRQGALRQGGAENCWGRGSFCKSGSKTLSIQERVSSYRSSTVSHNYGPSPVLVFLEIIAPVIFIAALNLVNTPTYCSKACIKERGRGYKCTSVIPGT